MEKKNNKFQGSATIEIERSKISLNPYNPKRHTDEQVKTQVKNIKRNGYLGGIVWNKTSGNLIDGHRRIQALDIINKYDGTNDYIVKVEVVEFDDVKEKEQMTYMAIGNSKADYNLIAEYISEIDPSTIGMSEQELSAIQSLYTDNSVVAPIQDMGDMFLSEHAKNKEPVFDISKDNMTFDDISIMRENSDHESADAIRAKKEKNIDVANRRNSDSDTYIMLKFANEDDQMAFCESVGIDYSSSIIIDGLELIRKIKEVEE